MKLILLIIQILIGFQLSLFSQPDIVKSNAIKRIVFLGNSITYAGEYISFIETYFKLHYPEKQLEFINVGLPSETVSGLSEKNHANGRFPRPDLHERLDRVLENLNPDLVFACYGMNDGIYLPFSDKRFKKFKKGIFGLNKKVVDSGASIIHVTPPIYDREKGEAYANVLDIYSDWLLSLKYTESWEVIDLHWPMKKYLENKRQDDPASFLAKDGIHPGREGHWLMAKSILTALEKDVGGQLKKFNPLENNDSKVNDLLKLVEKRQKIVKDAWLNHIGYTRPEMPAGVKIDDAKIQSENIEKQIQELIETENQ